MSPEEGGGTIELMPGGKDIEVTSSNVYDYVRKYAKYRMVKAQEKAIQVRLSLKSDRNKWGKMYTKFAN